MAFDFKKEYKGFYMPKNKPSIDDLTDNIYICEEERIVVSFKYEDEYRNAVDFIRKNRISEQVC